MEEKVKKSRGAARTTKRLVVVLSLLFAFGYLFFANDLSNRLDAGKPTKLWADVYSYRDFNSLTTIIHESDRVVIDELSTREQGVFLQLSDYSYNTEDSVFTGSVQVHLCDNKVAFMSIHSEEAYLQANCKSYLERFELPSGRFKEANENVITFVDSSCGLNCCILVVGDKRLVSGDPELGPWECDCGLGQKVRDRVLDLIFSIVAFFGNL